MLFAASLCIIYIVYNIQRVIKVKPKSEEHISEPMHKKMYITDLIIPKCTLDKNPNNEKQYDFFNKCKSAWSAKCTSLNSIKLGVL